MISYKHYYCTNCHYHGPEIIRMTYKFEIILKPHCPNCDKVSTYNDILEYHLQDDDTEYGGIGHTDYRLEEYLGETLCCKRRRDELIMSNQKLKIGDNVYVDILDDEQNMLTTLKKDEYLIETVLNVTDNYIQTNKSKYNRQTNEQIESLLENDHTSFFKKFYYTKEELFKERKRFKKYKIVYDAIKNETEYASFLKNLPEDVLDLIIQQIK